MVWLRRSFRALGVLLAVLMIATFVIPCGPVRASDGEITVNVRIEGYRDSNYPDGTILPTCQVSLPAGSTALDALKSAAEERGLSVVESNGFVTSIGGQASGHFGGWDGWMYRVNGYSPNVGADSYVLQEGDTVLWYYGDWAGTQYPDVHQFTKKDGYLNVELSSDSSPITGVSLTVHAVDSSVDASVYSRVYDSEDGTYTVVFADDQGNLLPPGEYTLKAEKFSEDGFPEMVKPEPVTINVVEGSPTPPNEPSITSAAPRGSQGIEVSGSADPGAQVVVTAVDNGGNVAAASKPVFADASGRFKAYLDIAEGGTYTLTATATKLEVKVEANGAISESSLPSAESQPFPLDVVEKPEILSAEYDPNTDSIIVELSRISNDEASIIVTLSIFGMDDLTQEVQTKPGATSYEVTFANLGIQAGGTYYCTVTAKAVLGDKESIEDTYFFSFSTAEVEEANLAEKAGAYIYSSYLLNGVTKGDNAVGSYALYVLKQAGVDVSIWERDGICLVDAVLQAISQDAGEPTGVSAKQLAQDILAAQELGKSDLVQQLLGVLQERHSESGFDGNIYSDVAAYELLGRAGYLSAVLDTVEAKVYARDYILGAQDTDPESETYGSFGSVWGETFYPDFMTTAQAVRALHYLDPQGEDEQVQEAIQAGLNWMRAQQQEDGSFAASDWDDPLIDTVEAIATLDVLEIEPTTWAHESSGKTPVDYMEEGALNEDGSFGSSRNVMDAVWALYGYHLLGLAVEKQLTISPSIMSLEVGSKGEYTLKFHDAEGESDVTREASWSVGNPSIAGIDGGQVTALSVGQTTVTAVYGGLTVTATLKVEAAEGPGGGAASPSTCTVGVAVVGKNGELLFGPGYVLLSKEGRWGLTALGALDATGLPYRLSDKWEGFVEEIAGQAGTGMEGWCYTVNGVMPMTSADKYQVKDGDRVIWYYSKSMDQQPPKWEDLVKQQAAGAIPAAEALKSVESTLSDLQSGKVSAGQAVSRLAETLEKLKESEVTEELKSKLSEAARLLAVALAKVPDKALTSQEEGEKVTIKIDGEILKDQAGVLKNASQLAEKLQKIGVSEGAALVKDELVVEVPDAFAHKSGLSTVFPASAGREVAEAGLSFTLREKEVSLRLPPEALKAVLGVLPDAAQVEVSVKKVDSAKAGLFEGASLVTKKAFDLEVCGVTPEGKKGKPSAFPERLTIAFSLEGVDLGKRDLSKLAVYRKKKDGSWEFVGGSLSADGKSFTFETDHLSLYVLAEFWKAFKDTEDHWAREAIDFLARRLIIRGVGGDRFAPDEKVTRAQFAALLVKALGIEEGQPGLPVFQDVPSGHWGCRAIEAAFKAGLVAGTGNGRFEPERRITREEMAVMLARLLEKRGVAVKLDASQVAETLASYSDHGAISAWAREGVAACVKSGLIRGRSASELAPRGTTTRAEAAVVVKNLLHFLNRI